MTDSIFFRTRGGPTQGWGNVVRLASFARWCREAGSESITFFAEGPPEVAAYLRDRGFEVVHLPEDVDLDAEARALQAHGRAAKIFVEMLDVTPERQALLRTACDQLVVFDDLCDHVYDADLVVCGQSLPSHANRSLSAPGTRFLTGPEYFLCRPEFLPYASRERRYSTRIESILVSLGGGAYDVGYLKAAHAIAALAPLANGPAPPRVTFVLGPARTELGAELAAILPQAEVLGGVDDLERRLWECDLAIVSGGYTKLEAAVTQTPCLVMSAQWHQIPLAEEFAKTTGVRHLGYMAYVRPEEITAAVHSLASADTRSFGAQRARRAVDGRGFERVWRAAFETQLAG